MLIDKKQFRVAEKNIPIFKIVFKKKYSPIQRTKLRKINCISIYEDYPEKYCFGYKFDANFYHACITKEDAEELIKDFQMQSDIFQNNLSIVEGYIPEGTRYALDNCGNICARKIILNL